MDKTAPDKEIIEAIMEAGGEKSRLCWQCGKCDVVCPWNRVRDFSMRKLVRQASFGLAEIELEEMWRCTTCGTCPKSCPRGVGQIEVGRAMRRLATEYGVFPAIARAAKGAGGSLKTDGNPLGEERAKRADWAEGLGVEDFEDGMEVLYFVGCYYAYDPRMRKAARATAEVLEEAEVEFGILGSRESCCGEAIRKTGNEEVFRQLAKENIKAFIDAGVKKVLVSSPHCYETFVKEYPEFMVHFEVVHITQYLLELIKTGRLELDGEYPRKVAYHDPCYLGRHNAIYEEPRELLRSVPGLELVELADHHEDSLCCGGGGGGVWMETDKDERFSNLRMEQAKAVGAEVLVTACPYCISMFEESRLTMEYDDVLEVMEISEIVKAVI